MKQLLYIVLTGAYVGMMSCTKDTIEHSSNAVTVSVIEDPTDPRTSSLLADPILSLYKFPDSMGREAYFRFTTISDKRLNPIVECHLASAEVTDKQNRFDDQHYREKLITLFYSKIRNTFAQYHAQYDSSSSMPFSECYWTIASELVVLVEHPASKFLVIHSDLLEKSGVFDCYTSEGSQVMAANPRYISELFLQVKALPGDLSGITVFFVYHPTTRAEEAQFMEMIEVYRLLLEPRHAKVVVQVNNDHFNVR